MAMPPSTPIILKDRPYFVMFEIMQGNQVILTDSVNTLNDNLNCLDAPFTFAVKANNVSAAAISGENEERGNSQVAGASCGTIEPPSSSGGGTGLLNLLIGFGLLLIFPKKIRTISL
jgi:hypothetical protein